MPDPIVISMSLVYISAIFMFVCSMFTGRPSVTVSMERDYINWAKGRGLSKKSYFPNHTWLATSHWLSCSWLWSRAELWRGNPGPFQAFLQLVLPGMETATPTSQEGEIIKSSPRRIHCKLRARFFGWGHRHRNYYIWPATASATSELFSKTRLPYTCITGHTTTHPHSIKHMFNTFLVKQGLVLSRRPEVSKPWIPDKQVASTN